jgi:hypothetical protein
MGGRNLYLFDDNTPISVIDPYGLWGFQFGDFRIGSGDVWLAFNEETLADIGEGAAATIDGFLPFGDPMSGTYYDPEDPDLVVSYACGEIARNALLTAGGIRGGAWLGGTRTGHFLNHNPVCRIGPGRMPANGPFPAGTHVPRISVGPQYPGSANPHIDLRLRGLDL